MLDFTRILSSVFGQIQFPVQKDRNLWGTSASNWVFDETLPALIVISSRIGSSFFCPTCSIQCQEDFFVYDVVRFQFVCYADLCSGIRPCEVLLGMAPFCWCPFAKSARCRNAHSSEFFHSVFGGSCVVVRAAHNNGSPRPR